MYYPEKLYYDDKNAQIYELHENMIVQFHKKLVMTMIIIKQ
jgi:hypothetical protein